MSEQGKGGAPEFNPKHRIMGAVVLVALAVIFVPMILERPKAPEKAPAPVMEIPDKDKKIFVSKIRPITPGEESAPPDEPLHTPTADTPAAPPSDQPEPAAPPEPAAEPPKKAPPTPSSKAPAPAMEDGWVVRVGTFSQAENAERITSTLKRKGFTPDSGEFEVGGRKVTRVWVGPFDTREQAAEVRSRILKETGQEGLIVAYP